MITFSFLNQTLLMLPSLKSSLRDDSNEWSHHRVWLRNKKVSILKTLNFRPYLLPCVGLLGMPIKPSILICYWLSEVKVTIPLMPEVLKPHPPAHSNKPEPKEEVKPCKSYCSLWGPRLHLTMIAQYSQTCHNWSYTVESLYLEVGGTFFTSSNYPKCKLICTSDNLDM